MPIKPGEAYRPYNLFNGGVVPVSVASRTDLSPGSKLLFGELASLLGKNGFCRPSLAHLAKRLGTSEDSITRWLAELTKCGLLKGRRGGPGSHTERVFIWHSTLRDSLKKGAVASALPVESQNKRAKRSRSETAKSRNQSTTDPAESGCMKPQKRDLLKPQNRGTLNKEEEVLKSRGSQEEESSSPKEVISVHDLADDWPPDDDVSVSSNSKPKPIRQVLLDFIKASGFPMPFGTLPDEEIEAKLNMIGGGQEDLERFLKTFQERLTSAPNTWKYIRTSILRWLSDSATARDIECRRVAREREEQRRKDEERRQQAESVKQRLLDEPIAPTAAIEKAREHLGKPLPPIVVKRLQRLGQQISPRAAIAEAKAWRDCRQCQNDGHLGSALKGTLQFCSCATGEEIRAEHGERFLNQQIDCANANLRARLIAACHDLKLFYTADRLKKSVVVEGDTIEVIVPTTFRLSTVRDLREPLAYIGDQRQVVVRYEGEKAQPLELPPEPNIFDGLFGAEW